MSAHDLRGALDLFELECARLWRIGLAAALLNSGLLTYYGRAMDLLQQPHFAVESAGAGYALLGWLLGVFQVASHRRPTDWVCLLHRPLRPQLIGLALVAAAALVILAAVALPSLGLVAGQRLLSERVVDTRHWLLPWAASTIVFSGYLAGGYAALVRRPFAPLLVVLPAAFAISNATGLWAVTLQLIVLLWLVALFLGAFRAEPAHAAMRPMAVAATAPPVAMALYLLLLFGGGSLYQAAWVIIGTHPLNGGAPAGGFVEAARSPGAKLVAAGLGSSAASDRSLRMTGPVITIVPEVGRFPEWGELINSGPISFDDEDRGVRWTFSHDRRHFRGLRKNDGSTYGVLSPLAGGDQLDRPPLHLGDGLMSDGRRLLRYDAGGGTIHSKLLIPPGEALAMRPKRFGAGEAYATASALYVSTPVHLSRLPLPATLGGLERIDLAWLDDGYLASFTYGRGWGGGRGSAFQQLVHVRPGAGASVVAFRSLERDYPSLFRLRGWWLSPSLNWVLNAFPDLLAPPPVIPDAPLSTVWGSPLLAAVLLAAISILGALWWTARTGRSAGEKAFWGCLALLLGAPAFLATLLYYPPPLFRRWSAG